jgi:hypothetical protein
MTAQAFTIIHSAMVDETNQTVTMSDLPRTRTKYILFFEKGKNYSLIIKSVLLNTNQ